MAGWRAATSKYASLPRPLRLQPVAQDVCRCAVAHRFPIRRQRRELSERPVPSPPHARKRVVTGVPPTNGDALFPRPLLLQPVAQHVCRCAVAHRFPIRRQRRELGERPVLFLLNKKHHTPTSHPIPQVHSPVAPGTCTHSGTSSEAPPLYCTSFVCRGCWVHDAYH